MYYAHYEKFTLIPKYHNFLPHYFRFIDDGLGIWLPNTDPDTSNNDSDVKFMEFKKDLDKFGLLRWTCEDLTNEIIYLGLVIRLDDGKFKVKTYQKALNLYLYIPPHSTHPPGVQKSLIFGCLQKYWNQNSDIKDFIHIAKLCFKRLEARGYNHEDLKRLFSEASTKLKSRKLLFTRSSIKQTEKTESVSTEKKKKSCISNTFTIQKIFLVLQSAHYMSNHAKSHH